MKLLLILIVINSLIYFSNSYTLKYVGSFKTPNPAFLKFAKIRDNAPVSLLISSFTVDPRKWGDIKVIENVGSYIQNISRVRIKQVASKNLYWPNEVNVVPKGAFLVGRNYIWTADGFLVPLKNTGGIHLIEVKNDGTFSETHEISTKKNGWFYHSVTWIDMNGDGKLDVVTARALKPLWGQDKGELIWLENPGIDFDKKKWKEHLIETGPDVSFSIDKLSENSNKIHIIATEFFGKRISLTEMEIGKPKPTVEYHRAIDTTIGSAYHVEIVDLEDNGKKSLLVTNHETKAENGAVFIYDIPFENLRSGTFKRHKIAKDFVIRGRGFNEAVPGIAYSIYPNNNLRKGNKHIVISGDGSHQAYLLKPKESYKYEKSVIRNVGGTCGSLAFEDVDNDGWKEIFIPNYDSGEVFVYKFQK